MRVFEIDCPRCRAQAGDYCRNPATGREYEFPELYHRKRLEEARQLSKEENGGSYRDIKKEAV